MTDQAKLELKIQSIDVKTATTRLDKFSASGKRAETRARRLGAATERSSRRLSGFAKTAKLAAGAVLALSVAIGSALAGLGSFKVIADFGFTMAQVRGIVVDTTLALEEQAEQYNALKNAARGYGATTEFTSAQAGKAALNLGRAGFATQEILDSLGDTLDLATAGVLDLATAARITSNTIRQFGLDAAETGVVVDALVAASNRANTTVGELGQAMSHAGTLAASLGLTVQETAASLAVLANRGITASKAGTAMRGIMVRLLNPTGEAADVLERLAEQSGQSRHAFSLLANTFEQVIVNLNNAGAGAKDLETIFGRFQIAGALGFVESADALVRMTEEVQKAQGEAKRLADIMRDTLTVDVKTFHSAVEALILNLGDAGLEGAMRAVVQFGTEVVRSLAGVTGENIKLSRSAVAVADSLKALTVTIGVYVTGLLVYTTATKAAVLATKTLNFVLKANVIGILVGALAAAVATLYTYRDTTLNVMDTQVRLGDIVGGVWDYIVDKVKWAGAIIGGIGGWLFREFNRLFKYIVKGVRRDLETIVRGFRVMGEFIQRVWGNIGPPIMTVLNGIVTAVRYVVNVAIGMFVAMKDTIVLAFKTALDVLTALGHFNPMEPIASAKRVGKALKSALDPSSIASELGDVWASALSDDYVGKAVKQVKIGAQKIKRAVVGSFDDPNTALNEALRSFAGFDVAGIAKFFRTLEHGNLSLAEAIDKRRRATEAARVAAGKGASVLGFYGRVLSKASTGFDPLIKEAKLMSQQIRELIEIIRAAGQESAIFLLDFENALDFDLKLAGKTAKAAAEMTEVDRLRQGVIKAFGGDLVEADRYLADHDDQVQRILDKYKLLVKTDELRQLGETVGTALGQTFEDIVFKVESAEDAVKNLIKTLLKLAFQKQVIDNLSAGFGNLFGNITQAATAAGGSGSFPNALGTAGTYRADSNSAKGNYFIGGQIQAFARGGGFDQGRLIEEPTLFGSAGQTALAGELGTEAIMPLKRMASGNLGTEVKLTGGGGGGNTTNKYTVNITTPDAASFHRSRGQVARDLQRATRTQTGR